MNLSLYKKHPLPWDIENPEEPDDDKNNKDKKREPNPDLDPSRN